MLLQMVVFSDEYSWSQPDSKIANMNSQADLLNSFSWGMLLPSRPSRLCYLRKHAIHCSEQAMLQILLCKNSFVPNSEVAVKLLFYRLGSAGTLVL